MHISFELDIGIRVVEKSCRMLRGVLTQRYGRTGIHDFLGHGKRKSGAFPIHAFHGDITIHKRYELFADGKPETGTFDIAVSLAVDLLEGFEKFSDILGFDADSGV